MKKCFITLLLFLTIIATAQQKKVALIIGNGEYSDYFKKLGTPVNDANAMNWSLNELGFETILGVNLDQNKMTELLNEFSKKARGADIALIYYSGHGGYSPNYRYYLIPRGEYNNLTTIEADCYDFEIVEKAMNTTGAKLKLFFIDACRNSLDGSKGTGQFSPFEQVKFLNKDNTAKGTAYYFGTSKDSPAFVGNGDFSPFTQALLNHIDDSGYFNDYVWSTIVDEVIRQYPQQKPTKSVSDGFIDFKLNPSGYHIDNRVKYGYKLINIKATPSNAKIKLGKKDYGNNVSVYLGFDKKYDIEIAADGYQTYKNTLSVFPSPYSQKEFVFKLAKLDTVTLDITSNVQDADVYVDNKPLGPANHKYKILSGPHDLKVEKKGYYRESITLDIHEQINKVHVDLSRDYPWFFKNPSYWNDAEIVTYHFSPKYQIGLSCLHRVSDHSSVGLMLGASADFFSQLATHKNYPYQEVNVSIGSNNINIVTEYIDTRKFEYSDYVDPFHEAKHYNINSLILVQYGYSPCEGITIDFGIGAAHHINKHFMKEPYFIKKTVINNIQTGEKNEPTYEYIKQGTPYTYKNNSKWSPALRLGSLFFIPIHAIDISIVLGGGYTYLPINNQYSSWDACLGISWEF